MPQRSTIEEFIKDGTLRHNKKYDYSKVSYINRNTKVVIICPIHGDFEQIPYSHLEGKGCAKCAGTEKSNNEDFIKKAKEMHNNKYDYSEVEYVNSKTKITIICHHHGPFKQIPNHHLRGSGCSKCNHGGTKSNTEDFIRKARELHKNKYDYSKVNYLNSKKKVTIICYTHGEFEQNPNDHLNGCGCLKCGYEVNTLKRKSNNEDFINRAKKLHGNKYDYSKVEYFNAKKKVLIICPIHGDFEQMPSGHINKGSGCAKCAGNRSDKENFISKSNKIHNNKYDYSKVEYVDWLKKVIIICPNHGQFEKSPGDHLKGGGCKICWLCISCGLFMTKNKLCSYCRPLIDNKKYGATKEMKIVKFLKKELPDYEFIHNRSVGSVCADKKYRPDIRFDCGTFQLIVEVDEFKHKGTSYECDNKRMLEIVAELGMPTIFIRYNPDNKDSNQEDLLKKVRLYLQCGTEITDNNVFGDYGVKVEYLFY